MTDYTDAELNAAVARVEGWTLTNSGEWMHMTHPNTGKKPPAYTTDAALWGPLIEKYQLRLDCRASHIGNAAAAPKGGDWIDAKTPGRAVCLAVLAAREGR